MSPIAFAIAVVWLLIFISKVFGLGRESEGSRASLGIKTVKSRNSLQLGLAIPLRMTLVVGRANVLSRAFGNTRLFRQPKSGDEEFDETFSITAYREDVMAVVRNDAGLRKVFIRLSKVNPCFWSIRLNNGELVFSLSSSGYKNEELDSIRQNFAAEMPNLIGPFANLPPDTPRQAFTRKLDLWSPYVLAILLGALMVVGPFYDQPLATNELPWKYIALGVGSFFAAQMVLLFTMTTQGATRIQGVLFALFASLINTVGVMPEIARGINTLAQKEMLTEVVEVENLYKVEPRKTSSHFYIVLTRTPTIIVSSSVGGAPTLEVTDAVYTSLENQSLQNGRKFEVKEAIGMLGLPFIVQVTPQ